MESLFLLLIGFVTGAYGIIVGAGGGVILAPVLIIVFNLEPAVAAGTSLALVFLNSVSGTHAYRRLGLIDYRSGILFAVAAIPGAALAPFLHIFVSDGIFKLVLGVLLVALAAQMAVKPRINRTEYNAKLTKQSNTTRKTRVIRTRGGEIHDYQFNEMLATSLNLFLGFMSSFFGTGGGFLRTPILIYAFNFPIRVAVATSIFAIGFYTLAGAIIHGLLGHIDWYPTLVWAGIGLVIGAQIGAKLASQMRSVWVLRLLLSLVLALGVILILEGIFA